MADGGVGCKLTFIPSDHLTTLLFYLSLYPAPPSNTVGSVQQAQELQGGTVLRPGCGMPTAAHVFFGGDNAPGGGGDPGDPRGRGDPAGGSPSPTTGGDNRMQLGTTTRLHYFIKFPTTFLHSPRPGTSTINGGSTGAFTI